MWVRAPEPNDKVDEGKTPSAACVGGSEDVHFHIPLSQVYAGIEPYKWKPYPTEIMFRQNTRGQESVSCQELGVRISKYVLHGAVGSEKRLSFDVQGKLLRQNTQKD